jgi:hypothetical protein
MNYYKLGLRTSGNVSSPENVMSEKVAAQMINYREVM